MTEYSIMDYNSLISALIGAIVGGALTLLATLLAYKLEQSTRKKEEEDLVQGYLHGIHDEIGLLWQQYITTAGIKLESLKKGEPFALYYPVNHDYFTIYTQNAHLIGKVPDHELRQKIISTYSMTKGLIDSYLLNNRLVKEYENAYWIDQNMGSGPPDPTCAIKMQACSSALSAYATQLKNSHDVLKTKVDDLLSLLKQHLNIP